MIAGANTCEVVVVYVGMTSHLPTEYTLIFNVFALPFSAGVDLPNPENETALGIGGPCPKGFWCPQTTSVPNPCPPGTYSDQEYLMSMSQCKACDLGMYCSEYNLTAPEGVCSPGFYCLNGSYTQTPTGKGMAWCDFVLYGGK